MTASKQKQTCPGAIGVGEGRGRAIGFVIHCRLINYPQINWLKATNILSWFLGAESWVPLAQIPPGCWNQGVRYGSLGEVSFLISPKWLLAGFGFS